MLRLSATTTVTVKSGIYNSGEDEEARSPCTMSLLTALSKSELFDILLYEAGQL